MRFFSSRLRALSQLSELGLYLTTEKRENILYGNMSGAVVHRHFVYALQAAGGYLRRAPENTSAMADSQAICDQMTWESLIALNETGQHRAKAQALVLVVHKFVLLGFTQSAKSFILKLCEIINNAQLRFLPDDTSLVELPEQIREDASVLSQAIYLENYSYLALDGSATAMTRRIEGEFRSNLRVRTFHAFFFLVPGIDLDIRSRKHAPISSRHVR